MDSEDSNSLDREETDVITLSDSRIFIHLHGGFDDWKDDNNEGKGPLHWLANNNNFTRKGDDVSYGQRVQMIHYFIAAGANVDVKDNYHCTALFEAAETGFYDGVKLLLEADADINSQSDSGKTPLHIAVLHGHIDIIELLLNYKADTTIKDGEGCTALHYACDSKESDKITEMLLQSGADVNVRDNKGWTPLHHAIICEKDEVIAKLWYHENSDINAVNHEGETPLQLLAAYRINPLLNDYLTNYIDSCIKTLSYEQIHCCKVLFKVVLLENPNLDLPERLASPLSSYLLSDLTNYWNCLQSEVKTMINEKITEEYSVYDLCLAENPVNFKKFLSDKSRLAIVEALDLEANFPNYSGQLKSNLESGKALHQKIMDTDYSLCDIYQEKDTAKLMRFFSDTRIETTVRQLLTVPALTDFFPDFFKKQLVTTLAGHLEIAIPKQDNRLEDMMQKYLFADELSTSNAISSQSPSSFFRCQTEASAIANDETHSYQSLGLFPVIESPSEASKEAKELLNKRRCLEK
jgi:ankyrin repeat protein